MTDELEIESVGWVHGGELVMGRNRYKPCQHSILETCAHQLRIYKSAFYSYNFHIFRLFGFGKEEVDVYRFMSKQFIALFVYLSFALSSLFLPKTCVVLFWEEKLVPSLSKFSHFIYFRTAHGNRRTWALLSYSVYFNIRIPLPFELTCFASL